LCMVALEKKNFKKRAASGENVLEWARHVTLGYSKKRAKIKLESVTLKRGFARASFGEKKKDTRGIKVKEKNTKVIPNMSKASKATTRGRVSWGSVSDKKRPFRRKVKELVE